MNYVNAVLNYLFLSWNSCRLWDNVEKYCRSGQMTIWHMRIACRITKATNTHPQYVILITLPLQQRLHERASLLRYTYSTLHVLLTARFSLQSGDGHTSCPFLLGDRKLSGKTRNLEWSPLERRGKGGISWSETVTSQAVHCPRRDVSLNTVSCHSPHFTVSICLVIGHFLGQS